MLQGANNCLPGAAEIIVIGTLGGPKLAAV